MFHFYIWYRNLQNFTLTQEDKQWKHRKYLKQTVFSDTNFLRFLEFLRTLELSFQRD